MKTIKNLTQENQQLYTGEKTILVNNKGKHDTTHKNSKGREERNMKTTNMSSNNKTTNKNINRMSSAQAKVIQRQAATCARNNILQRDNYFVNSSLANNSILRS